MAYYYPQNYQQPYQSFQQQPMQIQNGGIVRVATEDDARKYPVAPGYSVTFISEDGTHCYTKTAGFSQFEAPKFEKYRLIKEIEPKSELLDEGDKNIPEYATKADLDALRAEFNAFKEKSNE